MQDLETFITQHWQLAYSFAAVLTLLVIVELLRSKRSTMMVDTSRAVHLMNREHAAVIDLRTPDIFRQGHIIDAISLTPADIANSKKLEKIKTKPIVLVGSNDTETQKIAASLAKQGYNSHVLSGGLRAWKEAGLPLVKD